MGIVMESLSDSDPIGRWVFYSRINGPGCGGGGLYAQSNGAVRRGALLDPSGLRRTRRELGMHTLSLEHGVMTRGDTPSD